ncbi:MAG TPA: JAB domain-containing protein [Thermoanaerobaculia bacterium]|nr:JAB domain-containing protein [Thermoanaerobaculia bacterium]
MARNSRPETTAAVLDPREAEQESSSLDQLQLSNVGGLTDAELLAVVMSGGSPDAASRAGARLILDQPAGLRGLFDFDFDGLRAGGFGANRALALLANRELAVRFAQTQIPLRTAFARPREAVAYLVQRYRREPTEVFGVAWLDSRRRVLAQRALCRGILDRLSVDPRELLSEAVVRGAAAIVLFQLRPSGDLEPRAADLELSGRVLEACEEGGIDLADHLVVGTTPEPWVSLREWW